MHCACAREPFVFCGTPLFHNQLFIYYPRVLSLAPSVFVLARAAPTFASTVFSAQGKAVHAYIAADTGSALYIHMEKDLAATEYGGG